MTVTVKDIDAALDKYKGLTLFLAGVRSTLHETASLGIKHYIRAEAAEAHAKELEEIINKAKVDPNAEQTGDPAVDNSYTGQIAQLRGCLEAAEGDLVREYNKALAAEAKLEQILKYRPLLAHTEVCDVRSATNHLNGCNCGAAELQADIFEWGSKPVPEEHAGKAFPLATIYPEEEQTNG